MRNQSGLERRRGRSGSSGVGVWAVVAVVLIAAGVAAYLVLAREPATAPEGERPPGARKQADGEAPAGDDRTGEQPGDAAPSGPRPGKGDAAWAAALTSDDFVVVSGPTSPRVAYALRRTAARLDVVLDVATFTEDGTGASVELGLAAAKKILLSGEQAKQQSTRGKARLSFAVPAAGLVGTENDWKKLRMALAVSWSGGPAGSDRLRERFGHTDGRAPHAGLSPDPADWAPLDPDEYGTLVADRKKRIVIRLSQPMEGKATVVVENEGGERIRNLIAGAKMPAGEREVEWDGLGDEGVLVKAGTYRWRSVHHPGIVPEYLFSFCNGGERMLASFGSNHMLFTAAAANDEYVFYAAPMTEGGHAMIAVDTEGAWKHGYNPIHGSGMNAVAIAADEKFLYAAHDGEAWGQLFDRRKEGWKATVHL